ncbi:MAG: hypothetical protein ACP5VR_01300 [Acidimicrobiales bacterium]
MFLDTVAALRAALDQNLLEGAEQDDHLTSDLLLGDVVWETSVSLPGDGDPPRVSADISLDWPTWSQSAWRSMAMGEPVEDTPEIGIEIVFRAQRLAKRPVLDKILAVLPSESPDIGGDTLSRSAPVIEEAFSDDGAVAEFAVEVAYEGAYRLPAEGALDEPTRSNAANDAATGALALTAWGAPSPALANGPRSRAATTRQLSAVTEATLASLGTWVASTLVHLADLDLEYLPPPDDDLS